MDRSPSSRRAQETRAAFAEGDAAKSREAHDATSICEDGHGEGDAAVELYRRVDAAQAGLCLAVLLESALGGTVARARLIGLGLALALAHGLREWSSQAWYERHYRREYAREEWELDNYAQGEKEEMVGLWSHKGLRRADAEAVIAVLANYRRFFVDLMMTEELRMFAPAAEPSKRRATAALCVAGGVVGPLALGGAAGVLSALALSPDGAALFPTRAAEAFVTTGVATSCLAATGSWRAATSRLPEQRHALESAALGLACYALPKLLL